MSSSDQTKQILDAIVSMQQQQLKLVDKVDRLDKDFAKQLLHMTNKIEELAVAGVAEVKKEKYKVFAYDGHSSTPANVDSDDDDQVEQDRARAQSTLSVRSSAAESTASSSVAGASNVKSPGSKKNLNAQMYNHRIILTTYPGQLGMNPLPLQWGNIDPKIRGPVLCSRTPQSLKYRNAIGALGGSYSIYRALAIAIGELSPNHKPDFHNTLPFIDIGPYPSWGVPDKIVALDPFGHIVVKVYADHLKQGIDIRPTIAITKAHMKVPEIEQSVKNGTLKVDGTIVLPNGELNVTKGAVEPVWYLPGVASRFGVDETVLRRCLFEDTGGMYPELITRPDLKVFLPPIGGLSIYCFGPLQYLSDPTKKLSVRVHDECNGSDVFGSDICTCRPYLMFGIEECVKTAQEGGVGLIVYFRKEGRALGEVTKYLVYNARKRAEEGDTASSYFKRTEFIAGVQDMRFQALMPDVLHWLGITKIDRFLSMSHHKYDALVKSGIEVRERVEIPESMIPEDSKVEIEAKIASGYKSSKVVTAENLLNTKGRDYADFCTNIG
ncbi:hypothetical protein MIR68_006100 [Amoeboaphelidium protococcarum]|nr:hypothetical protein MIR68_006100 [Amoeboaphelidium protococcarum]